MQKNAFRLSRLPAQLPAQLLVGAALSATAALAAAGPIRSVGSMTFVDANTLVVADRQGGEIHAITLSGAAQAQPGSFNLKQLSGLVAKALHTTPEKLRFEDLAFRPGTELAYISLSIDRGASQAASPAVVWVDRTGKVKALDLAHAPHTSAAIKDRPSPDKAFWNDMPASTLTVTDMTFYKGRLYVAGLSNATFASTLRIFDYPFNGQSTATSVEMYHAVHNQTETRAPIRKMTIAELGGEPTLIAAYTCTPLVTIPLKDLQDGAHIVGKTVAELGWGSAPVGMVSFDAGQGPMVLLANSHKSADLMTVASIADGAAKPGLHEPIKWPAEPYLGVKSIPVPLSGLANLAVQDKEFLAALRRNAATGSMELVSMRNWAFLRISDFVNEYDFADFKYPPGDPFIGMHHQLRGDEGYPNLADRAKP